MRLLLLLAGLWGWLAPGLAPAPARYFTRTGTISFFSATPIEDIAARSQQVGAVVDVQTGQVAFTALLKDFKFAKSLMQDHFNENYVESEKYPKAVFNGHLVDWSAGTLAKAGPQPVLVEGDLTLHGVTQHVRVPGTLVLQANHLLVNAKFAVAPADYRIEIPLLVRGHIAKTVDVAVALTCDPLP
jgi:hypothetical protein